MDTPRFWTVDKNRCPNVLLYIAIWPRKVDRGFASLGGDRDMTFHSHNKLIAQGRRLCLLSARELTVGSPVSG